ncbi:MAG: hypothetical protein FWE95_05330 [Planctomycetaceae bacterium]|nr:hypothetical protein [Planctomycetaceae bacterium]
MKHTLAFLLALFCTPLFAIEDELRQARLLTNQGQFAAVEVLCQEVFAQPNVADIDKIRLATELVRSRSMQLLTVESAQRAAIVRRLETLEITWFSPIADNVVPDRVLAKITLRLQLAMAYQSLGDDQRLEGDVASVANMEAAYQRARVTLHDAIERLKLCQRELQTFRQRQLALEYSITMQLGIARKSLALTLTEEAERNFELRQAAAMLSELASISSTDPVIVQCKVEKAACHRLAGELEQCANILTQLLGVAASLSPECRLRVEAEWIRYHVVSRTNITGMRQQYAQDRTDASRHPDFDLARLELFLVNDPGRNIQPEHAVAMRFEQTMRQLNAYWGRRAATTVSVMMRDNPGSVSATVLATLADTRFREGQFTESAELYEQAAARADVNRQAEEMYRYNRLAVAAWATAMEQLPSGVSTVEYEDRLIPLLLKMAKQNPNHPEALGFHAQTILWMRKRIAQQPEVLDECVALINEHAELWKESPVLPEFRRWLIVQLERQGRTSEAAVLLSLLDLEQLGALPPEIQRLRARQLDTEGNTQEAIAILTALLERHEPTTLQLIAEILSRQTDAKSLNDALDYWGELERTTTRNSEPWWAAREGIIEVLFKLDQRDRAKQSFAPLPILYPALGGEERKERLMKRFEER